MKATGVCARVAVLALLVAAAGAWGETWYVGPDGDDAGDGSKARPWKTLTHAAGQAKAGDTVLALSGTYYEEVAIKASGSPGKPIIFRSAQKHQAVITYPKAGPTLKHPDASENARKKTGLDKVWSWGPVVDITGANIQFLDFRVEGYRQRRPGGLLKVHRFQRIGDTQTWYIGYDDVCLNIRCERPEDEDFRANIVIRGNDVCYSEYCAVKTWGSAGVLIEDNDLHDCGIECEGERHGNAVYIAGHHVTVRNNRILKTELSAIEFWDPRVHDIRVEGNVIASVGGTALIPGGRDCEFLNNTLYDNGGGVMLFREGCKNARIVNNIFARNRGPDIIFDNSGGGTAMPSGTMLRNNCFWPLKAQSIPKAWLGEAVAKVGGGAAAEITVGGNFLADPQFVDAAKGDFRLQPTSPCLGAGQKVGENLPDIGAPAK